MKEDPEFNIHFVSVVENFPCLYDYTCTDYSKRNVVDNVWENIAKQISESVQDCKERWKNLRACYTRHLKSLTDTPSGSEAKAKRPYYLAEHLSYLQPFTKSRKAKGIYKVPQSPISCPEETQVAEYGTPNDSEEELSEPISQPDISKNSVGNTHSQVEHLGTSVIKKNLKSKSNLKTTDVSLADVNRTALDYFKSKTSRKEKKLEHPDLDFLKSILPDMNEMNNNQKRRFKIGILNLAGQILSEDRSLSSRALSSSTSHQGINYAEPLVPTTQPADCL